jgi:hypothetical protein
MVPKGNGIFTCKINAAIITCCNFGTDMVMINLIHSITYTIVNG